MDEDLNNLKISDEALLNVAKLSKYDFDQDLSVTILGHIFEQSISDLEEIKSKVNHDEKNSNSKRKKKVFLYSGLYCEIYSGQFFRELFTKKKKVLKLNLV